jgi:tRNA nucleotidyltransferase (CCA-adding enzyme)
MFGLLSELDIAELPYPCYVVGGWVRDQILGRSPDRLDLDLVLTEQVIPTAKRFAQKYGGGFVVLDQERQIARVVLPQGTIDFALQVGADIRDDLGKRDFAMNAIAIEVHDPATAIDPYGGQEDIHRKLVRMIHPDNLKADGLRILRAYRQAAQLDFQIEENTRQHLIKLRGKLAHVASERVLMELSYLLEHGAYWLCQALTDGVLEHWLPSPVLEITRFQQIDSVIRDLVVNYPQLQPFFSQNLCKERPALVAVKLASLINSAYAIEPLGLSRNEQRWLVGILRYLPTFRAEVADLQPIPAYRLFQATNAFFPALVAVAIAEGVHLVLCQPWLERWLDPHDPIAHPVTLLRGDEIKQIFHLKQSPRIGELLEAVRLAQLQGLIGDRQGAIDYLSKIM